MFSDIADPECRGRSLFALIPCFPHPERGCYEQIFRQSTHISDEVRRATYLIDIFGGPLYDAMMEEVGRQAVAVAQAMSDPVPATLLKAHFDQESSGAALEIVRQALRVEREEDRVHLLEAVRIWLLDTRGIHEYLDVADALDHPDHRARAMLSLARVTTVGTTVERVVKAANAALDPLLRNRIFCDLEAFVEGFDAVTSRLQRRDCNRSISDPEVRARCQIEVLSLLASEAENRETAELIFDAIDKVANPDLRILLLSSYVHSLPGGAPWCGDRALALVTSIKPASLRAKGLSVIRHLSDPQQVISAAMQLDEPWARAAVLFVYRHGYGVDGLSQAEWLDRLHAAALAIPEPSPKAMYLTLLAADSGGESRELGRQALHAAGEIQDHWARAQAIDRLCELGVVSFLRLEDELSLAWRIPHLGRRARAVARLSRHLPNRERAEMIARVFRLVWGECPEQDIAAVLRHVVADGELEAWRSEGDVR